MTVTPGKLAVVVEQPCVCQRCGGPFIYYRKYKQAKTPKCCPDCLKKQKRDNDKERARQIKEANDRIDHENNILIDIIINGKKPKKIGPGLDAMIDLAKELGVSYGKLRSMIYWEGVRREREAMRGMQPADNRKAGDVS